MRLLSILFCLSATGAAAQNVTVQFLDGAPKDSLTLKNTGCPILNTTFVLDLGGSAGALIFDTSAQGAGVAVFQPVESQSNNVALSPVSDGDQVLDMRVTTLPIDGVLRLTADLDDTLSGSQITVSGSEMAGATITAIAAGQSTTNTFDSNGIAQLSLPAPAVVCVSS